MAINWSKDVDQELAITNEKGIPIWLDLSAAPPRQNVRHAKPWAHHGHQLKGDDKLMPE